MKSYDVIAYTFEADLHCVDCTIKRFGGLPEFGALDSEGNEPQPVFADQYGDLVEEVDNDYGSTTQYAPRCADCGEELLD